MEYSIAGTCTFTKMFYSVVKKLWAKKSGAQPTTILIQNKNNMIYK